jgi:linearmycin/streptolysin S transport system permease protein
MLGPTIKKEMQLLRRDPRALVRLLVLPVAFIALFGMVFNAQDHKQGSAKPIPVWIEQGAPYGDAIVAAIDRSKVFQAIKATSAAELRAAVAAEQYEAGIIVPRTFDPGAGHPAELVIDLGRPIQVRGPLQGALTGIVTSAVVGGAGPPHVLDARSPPGIKAPLSGLSSFQVTVPGNAVLFGFFIALTCAMSFAEERRTGTWRRLLAAPVSRWKLLVAKLVPYVAIGAAQVGLLFGIGAVAFGMKVAGSVPALAVLTIGVAACATTLGLLIASLSTTEKQISSLGAVVILVMGLVGGCMLPRPLMPHALQSLGLAVPHGWALDGYYTLLVRKGAGFADVAKQIGAVYGFAALFFLAGVRRFRFEE